MIALICFVLAVLASPFKSKSRLGALGGFTIITSGLSFRYAHEGIWLSRAILQLSHNRRFATALFCDTTDRS
jgi:hypothetical protein